MRASASTKQLRGPPFPPHSHPRTPGQSFAQFPTPQVPSYSSNSALPGTLRKSKRVIRNISSAGSKKSILKNKVVLFKQTSPTSSSHTRNPKLSSHLVPPPPPLVPPHSSSLSDLKNRTAPQNTSMLASQFLTPKSGASFCAAAMIYAQNSSQSKKFG